MGEGHNCVKSAQFENSLRLTARREQNAQGSTVGRQTLTGLDQQRETRTVNKVHFAEVYNDRRLLDLADRSKKGLTKLRRGGKVHFADGLDDRSLCFMTMAYD